MQHEPLRQQATVDAKTAEEALALAVRLQQERGDRVSLEQIQRTAAEAGIDRDVLAEALAKVQAAKAVQPATTIQPERAKTAAVAMVVAIAFSLALSLMLARNGVAGGDPPIGMVVAFLSAMFVGLLIRRLRQRS